MSKALEAAWRAAGELQLTSLSRRSYKPLMTPFTHLRRCLRCLAEEGSKCGDSLAHVAARLDLVPGAWQRCTRTGDEYNVYFDVDAAQTKNMVKRKKMSLHERLSTHKTYAQQASDSDRRKAGLLRDAAAHPRQCSDS